MNDTPLDVEDFSAFRCHYSTGKGMHQVTLLFTVHPAFPWLVTAGLILFASMMILWIEPHLPQQAVRMRASAHLIATAASSKNYSGTRRY